VGGEWLWWNHHSLIHHRKVVRVKARRIVETHPESPSRATHLISLVVLESVGGEGGERVCPMMMMMMMMTMMHAQVMQRHHVRNYAWPRVMPSALPWTREYPIDGGGGGGGVHHEHHPPLEVLLMRYP
jgi:hypothetical protein